MKNGSIVTKIMHNIFIHDDVYCGPHSWDAKCKSHFTMATISTIFCVVTSDDLRALDP